MSDDEFLVALVRTDFTDDAAWSAIVEAVNAQADTGVAVPVLAIDDAKFDGADPQAVVAGLTEAQRSQGIVLIADGRAFSDGDHPLLAVDTFDAKLRSFRVIANEAWGPVANIPIANMDWEDFADNVDDNGVHRGF